MSESRKIWVIGSSHHYSRWMEGSKASSIEESDLVVLTGGSDVSPELYGEKVGRYTYYSKMRDVFELEEVNKAIKLNIPIIGICRGLQLLSVVAGGSLVQHINHPNRHLIKLWDSSYIYTNSLHHQMVKLSKLPSDDYRIIGYAEGLSDVYLNGTNTHTIMPRTLSEKIIEPEIVYFTKINAIGIQGHPEMLNNNSELVSLGRGLLDNLIEGTLLNTIDNNIPASNVIKSYNKLIKNE